MNIKGNLEQNFNLYEKPKQDQENYMFYNQNQQINKIPQNIPINFVQNHQGFQQGNFNQKNPNINYFNNYNQQGGGDKGFNNRSKFTEFKQEEFPPNMNKMNMPQNNVPKQYNLNLPQNPGIHL